MVAPIPVPNAERKAREFAKREEEILRAALDLFDPEHWDQITVAQIAAHTGIGKGTIYKHFSSKEEIYARLAFDDGRRLLAQFAEIVDDAAAGSGLAQVRRLLEVSFANHLKNPALGSVHMYCKQLCLRGRLGAESHQQLTELEHDLMALFSQPLIRGVAAGEIVNVPLPILFTGMHATFEGALVMLRNQNFTCIGNDGEFCAASQVSAEQFIQNIIDYMMAALTASRQSLIHELAAGLTTPAAAKG